MFAIGREVTFVLHSWSGYPVRAVRVFYPLVFSLGEFRNHAWGVIEMLKKSDVAARSVTGSALVPDPVAEENWPTLWSHLTQSKWEDGSPRPTSSFLVFEQDGILKVMVRDKSAGQCLWLACHRLSDLLAAVELGLTDPSADWRIDRQKEGDLAKRVKKSGGR